MTTRQIAHGIAQLGRHGDSTLVHMQPHEVAGLQALAKANGTSMTINPHTGLPEAFSLGGFFKSLLPVFAGAATGGAGMPLWAGIAAGAATGAATSKDPLTGALMGGMGGYGGFNLGQGFANMGAMNAAANPEGFANAAAINASNAAGPTAVGNSIADGAAILNQGVNPAITQGITQAGGNVADPLTQDFMKSASENLARSGQNLKDVVTMQPGAWDSFKQGLAGLDKAPLTDLQAAGKIAMPLGGAVLSGLEPTDIYGQPIKYDTSGQKYDPYKTLNLNTNTGLKLYATGGPVSFADGGDALKGGGKEVLEGSGLLPLDVSDINAKYGYNPSQSMASSGFGRGISANPADYLANAREPARVGMAFGGRGGLGTFALRGPSVSIEVPKLGLFASNDQIEAARTAYEQQLAAAMAGRGGMGSTPNAAQLGRLHSSNTGATIDSGIGALNTAKTAETAPTAETALSRLNLNKQYATGGTIQSGGVQDLYNQSDDTTAGVALSRDGYGLGRLNAMAQGGVPGYKAGGYLDGPGDGMSDSIPATIEGRQPARLADGEFVIPADVVSHLGNGSTKAGSERLYGMLDKVRKARTGTTKQGKKINPAKYMPA